MGRPLSIKFTELDLIVAAINSSANDFTPATLSNTAPGCTLIANSNSDSVFRMDQECVGKVGDLYRKEASCLQTVSASFQDLEYHMGLGFNPLTH